MAKPSDEPPPESHAPEPLPAPEEEPEPDATTVRDAMCAAVAMGRTLQAYAEAIPKLPRGHLVHAVRTIEELIFGDKSPATRARLCLLISIDTVVSEGATGTGLGEVFGKHFTDLGSERDLAVLSDREGEAYLAFAGDFLSWLFAGPYVDARQHSSLASIAVRVERAGAGSALIPANRPHEPREPWTRSHGQLAFAAVAAFHVAFPKEAMLALASRGKVEDAIARWRKGSKDRWTAAAALADAVGLGIGAASLRGQWADHEVARKKGVSFAVHPLSATPIHGGTTDASTPPSPSRALPKRAQ